MSDLRCGRPHEPRAGQRLLLSIFAWFCLAGLGAAAAADAPQLQTDSTNPSGGYYRLTWEWPEERNRRFELQEAGSRDFAAPQTLYMGPDRASVLSGRSDGVFYYRVRVNPESGSPGPWSEAVEVRVEHHPLSRAFAFFAVGAVVFLATLVLVVGGTLKARKQEHA